MITITILLQLTNPHGLYMIIHMIYMYMKKDITFLHLQQETADICMQDKNSLLFNVLNIVLPFLRIHHSLLDQNIYIFYLYQVIPVFHHFLVTDAL